MRWDLKHRFWASDGDPGPLAWCIASVSLVLPVAGCMASLAGGWMLLRHARDGWLVLGSGVAALAIDIAIDLVWAHPGVSESDQPDLNRRAAQFVGRRAQVSAPIRDGRGKVRIGDSEWPAEGPNLETGAHVRVMAVNGMGLVVAPD